MPPTRHGDTQGLQQNHHTPTSGPQRSWQRHSRLAAGPHLVNTSGLLFICLRATMACSCCSNSTKPRPLDRGWPSGPTFSASRRILTWSKAGRHARDQSQAGRRAEARQPGAMWLQGTAAQGSLHSLQRHAMQPTGHRRHGPSRHRPSRPHRHQEPAPPPHLLDDRPLLAGLVLDCLQEQLPQLLLVHRVGDVAHAEARGADKEVGALQLELLLLCCALAALPVKEGAAQGGASACSRGWWDVGADAGSAGCAVH